MTQNNKYRTSPYPLFFFASNLICILLPLNALFAQVRINEVMLRPKIDEILVQLQSLKACSQGTYGSEYIELYKPNSNKSIDISYFIIGFNDNFSAQFNGSLRFFLGAKIGPFDFLSIGGSNSGVDIILTTFCSNPRLNMGNNRCSLQNGKRYISLYDNIGISFDAVYWILSIAEEQNLLSDSNVKIVFEEIEPISTPYKILFLLGLPKIRSGKIMCRKLPKVAEKVFTKIEDLSTFVNLYVVAQINKVAV